MPVRTVVAEDNRFMMDHLCGMLMRDGRFEVVASTEDAFKAESFCRAHTVDLCLMDVQTLHNHSGLSAGERIRGIERFSPIRVVIVTSLIDPEILRRAKAGAADSLWYKDHGDMSLMEVIDRTLGGERVFPDQSPSVELKDMFSAEITPRQLIILRRFVEGMTYDEIAKEQKLSVSGVRWNLEQIVQKGGFKNKHEMLAAVIENRLIVTTLMERGEK